MSRAVLITLALSILSTAAAVLVNLLVRTGVGPAHFWADLSWSVARATWLIVAMMWCTERVVTSNRNGWKKVAAKVDRLETHLGEVEEVVGDIDKTRVQANEVVVELFKHRSAR